MYAALGLVGAENPAGNVVAATTRPGVISAPEALPLRIDCRGAPSGAGGAELHLLEHLAVATEGGKRDELAPPLGGGHGTARPVLNNALDNASKHRFPALLLALAYVWPRGCQR